MDVYIVRPGDTLYALARRYSTTAERLARLNQLDDPGRLLPNQALLVPGGTAVDRQEILVNAYAYPEISDAVLAETLPGISFLCPFSRRVTPGGALAPLDDARIVSAALAQGVAPFLTVTNLSESGGFSSDLAHAVFTDQQVQDTTVASILDTLSQGRWAGVNLNFEYVYPFDRESYNQFLRRLSELLHARGWYLSTAIAPKESAGQEGLLYSAHDYGAHGRWADWVVLMTYEWGYTYGPPMAVAPIDRVRQVLDYAVSVMPAGKLLLGVPNYGYDWTLPFRQGSAARVLSNVGAVTLAGQAGAAIEYDERAQSPFFRYYDSEGRQHEVRFEDARSIRAKYALVAEYGLAGISIWNLNTYYRTLYLLLESMYGTEKLI